MLYEEEAEAEHKRREEKSRDGDKRWTAMYDKAGHRHAALAAGDAASCRFLFYARRAGALGRACRPVCLSGRHHLLSRLAMDHWRAALAGAMAGDGGF